MKDRTGERYGMVVVVSPVGVETNGTVKWKCICDCGSTFIKTISDQRVSCGCKKAQTGYLNKRHGMSESPEYTVWLGMRGRVLRKTDKRYGSYGGRGIKICKRWDLFENFYKDMGARPAGFTLERINNNGDYKPSNCRWASWEDQRRNTRKSLVHKGETAAEASRRLGMNSGEVSHRIKRGWSIEKAFTTPKVYLSSRNA